MSRRRIAIGLAALLGAAALALVAAAVFFHLSPRDYPLVAALSRTARIELSEDSGGWEIYTFDDPKDVAHMVSEVTASLGRRHEAATAAYSCQAHFFSESGSEQLTLAWRDMGPTPFAVRLSGESRFRVVDVDGYAYLSSYFEFAKQRRRLGFVDSAVGPQSVCFVYDGGSKETRGATVYLASDGKNRRVELLERGGTTEVLASRDGGLFWSQFVAREDIEAVRVTLDGKTTTLPVPRPRYAKPPVAEGP